MFYECAYNMAQHFTKSNRHLTYMHYSEASQESACRRVNGQIASYFHELIVLSRKLSAQRPVDCQIASYFHELIVLSRKRSNPSLKYLCFTNPHTTMHNTSQNLSDIFPTSTSHRPLMEVLAAVYLCITNLHTTSHNTSQNLIDILHTSTSHRRLK